MKIHRKFCGLFLIALSLCLSGCIEKAARDAAAAAQGFIVQAQANHNAECTANPALDFPCQTINRAIAAQNLLIDSLETYCGWPTRPTADQLKNFTAPCNGSAGAKATLTIAISNLKDILPDLQRAAGKAVTP